MRSFLGAPIRAHGRVFGNLYLTDKQGASEFTDDDEAAILVLATQAGIAIANAQLYAELQLHERWLDSVREVATTLLVGDRSLRRSSSSRSTLASSATRTWPRSASPKVEGLRIVVADGAGAHDLLGVEVPLLRVPSPPRSSAPSEPWSSQTRATRP